MNNYYSSFGGMAFGPDSDGTFRLGKFATSNRDVQFALDQVTTQKALDICCDDGGTAIAAGSDVMPARFRMLIRTAIAGSPDLSIWGMEGILKFGAVASTATGNQAGVWAYVETVSGSTVAGNVSGLHAMVSLPSGATLSTASVLAGVHISADTLAGTSTGDMSAIYVSVPGAGTWDYFLQIGAASGITDDVARTGTTSAHNLKVKLGATVFYIPLIAAT